MCDNCQSEKRLIWPPNIRPQDLQDVAQGNWISLKQCSKCNSFWVESAYEPYASFIYLVRWNYTVADWNYLNSIDNSELLIEWHKQEIKMHWTKLSSEDQLLIEKHRQRAYHQYDPIDLPNKKIIIEDLII